MNKQVKRVQGTVPQRIYQDYRVVASLKSGFECDKLAAALVLFAQASGSQREIAMQTVREVKANGSK